MPMRCVVCLLVITLSGAVAETVRPTVISCLPEGRIRRHTIAAPPSDPIAPLELSDISVDRNLNGKQVAALVDGLVDAIEGAAAEDIDPELAAWFEEQRALRTAFWLALDWRYDDRKQALAVLDQLRRHDAERCARFFHLAIAMAVVHDQPDAVASSRYHMIWGVGADQWVEIPDRLEIWDYLTASADSRHFPYPLDKLVWPLLVHVVDLDLNASERSWAIQQYRNARGKLSSTYKQVPYDYDKLNGKQSKLGNAPYTLANLLQHGGVCVDQSYFASRVMKCFGIPAIKCRGEGRYGGIGHAWTGFFEANNRSARFAFTGRYNFDYYYTGTVFDPQVRHFVLDRHMAMALDGALLDYHKFVEAGALTRIAGQVIETDPERAVRLLSTALDRNPLHRQAWLTLMNLVRRGAVSEKDARKWINRMARVLGEHPDTALDCLELVIDTVASEKRDRAALYKAIYQLLGSRPDLQIRLRLRQCGELVAGDDLELAIELALETACTNAKEGMLILPLVELVVEEVVERPERIRALVRHHLEKMVGQFPKKRGNEVSKAWKDLQSLIARLET